MEKCKKHTQETHRQIELIAKQHKSNAKGGSVIFGDMLTCRQIDDILDDVVCRSLGHEIGHNAVPRALRGTSDLVCKKCGSLLTIEAKDAYREIVTHH